MDTLDTPYKIPGFIWVTNCHFDDLKKYREALNVDVYQNRPRPTTKYSIKELEKMKMYGLYKKDLEDKYGDNHVPERDMKPYKC